MQDPRNRVYTNGEITIFWRPAACIHATTCFAELRTVFDPAKRPWINPNGAPTEKILEIIEKCPTSALTFRWNDEQRNADEQSEKLFRGNDADYSQPRSQKKVEEPVEITIRPNGPIILSGSFSVTDHDGAPLRPMRIMSLCRCGLSKNQPFCDGTHFAAGFRDDN